MTNNKPLFLFVGKSASGKTTIANLLEEREGMKQVQSYTTRPQRFEGETGHRFIANEEYFKLEDIVASTTYNGYWYCATLEQVKEADIYVIDIDGVKELLDNYDMIDRNIYIIYFDSNTVNRIERMIERGSTDRQIIERILVDDCYDWHKELCSMEYCSEKVFWEDNKLYCINANQDIDTVYDETKYIIELLCLYHKVCNAN